MNIILLRPIISFSATPIQILPVSKKKHRKFGRFYCMFAPKALDLFEKLLLNFHCEQFDKIENLKVVPESQCVKHKKSSLNVQDRINK